MGDQRGVAVCVCPSMRRVGYQGQKGVFDDQSVELVRVSGDNIDGHSAPDGLAVGHNPSGINFGVVEEVLQGGLRVNANPLLAGNPLAQAVPAIRKEEDVTIKVVGKGFRDRKPVALERRAEDGE